MGVISKIACACKICNQGSHLLFEILVLQKYRVKYYKCQNCGFIQTEDPYWLTEAYSSPIGLIDVGLLQRNILLSEKVSVILDEIHSVNGTYLDYGGGYGIFVRLMRDKGFNFYLYEMYAQNLFAKYFEMEDAETKNGFDCLTAFEVFEHFVNPVEEIEKMFRWAKTIIFSTELQPNDYIEKAADWWYFVPEAGQHVSLYSLDSLLQLKKYFDCHLYTDKNHIHILSKVALKDPFRHVLAKKSSIVKRIKNRLFKVAKKNNKQTVRESLLMKDFDYYKNKLSNGKI